MRFQGIKVTLVTGFLGAGKTTLIRHLLEQAPPNERWAVLVNEFGDIGLDRAFYEDLGVAISDVPGGCVCCTTSAAFQKGLNQLIRQHNPDRIFIEPSGLGHPKQIIQKLRGDEYRDVLLLSGVFCVLDARTLSDERYTTHDIYKDQIESADALVLSHIDQYTPDDFVALKTRLREPPYITPTVFQSNPMSLNINCLDLGLADIAHSKRKNSLYEYMAHKHIKHFNVNHRHHLQNHSHDQSHDHSSVKAQTEEERNDGWHYQKQQDGMKVLGWLWSKGEVFSRQSVDGFIQSIAHLEDVYRIKGVFDIGDEQAIFVNVARGEVSTSQRHWQETSRLEIIGSVEGDWPEKAQIDCFNHLLTSK
ncbi:GTP-binding protein [Marinomonas sp. A79]|uniref:GTP-binding protein n=1 Tax=Marinomonas vulgaris TaxID=2823372 RepID=A0ABS5HDV6_9GAMM|nr:GTP-binding protein [Marinomonas vulgaris]MBR7889578.1 GTP-binding protein [Marinomonas vulgaris]